MTTIDQLIELADKHQAADEYISGSYEWHKGSCAIGCTLRDARKLKIIPKTEVGDHASAAKAMGTTELVARLMDHAFEGVSDRVRPSMTPRFLRAIRDSGTTPGLNSSIIARMMERLVGEAVNKEIAIAAKTVASLYRRRSCGNEPSRAKWDAAIQQAAAAKHLADSAWRQAAATKQLTNTAWRQANSVWQQANSVWQADSAWQQADAAWQQANSTTQQADSATQHYWLWIAEMVMEEIKR